MNPRLEHLRRRRAAVIASILRRERQGRELGGRLHAFARLERAIWGMTSTGRAA